MDLSKIKKDFPILNREINGRPIIYLDSSATSQKPQPVIDAITNYYKNANANVHRGIYQLSEDATEKYEQARETVRNFINAESIDEVIFTAGATESINLVAYSWASKNLKEGDIVLVSEMEHHSNFVPWYALEPKGIKREFIPVMPNGTLDLEVYESMLKNPDVKLAAFTHVSNVLGTINPVQKMVQMAHEHDVLTMVDGAQAVPHMRVDVQAMDCDFYAFSSHKMMGPTGIGVLYARKDILKEMSHFLVGGSMISVVKKDRVLYNELPYRFEAGTPHVAGAIGLAAAIDYLNAIGLDAIQQHEEDLAKYSYNRFSEEFSGGSVKIYGPSPEHSQSARAGIISFTMDCAHPHDISSILDQDNVYVRSGHHCAQPLIDLMGAEAMTRASFYLYNDKSDVDALVDSLKKVQEVFA